MSLIYSGGILICHRQTISVPSEFCSKHSRLQSVAFMGDIIVIDRTKITYTTQVKIP